jgi:hypothetical protein
MTMCWRTPASAPLAQGWPTASDADNVYITLAAREKNRAVSIHARGEGDVDCAGSSWRAPIK